MATTETTRNFHLFPLTVELPSAFYADHADRDLPSGTIIKHLAKGKYVRVELDKEAFLDLLSDARHYADKDVYQGMGKEHLGLHLSAKATVKRLEPFEAQIPTAEEIAEREADIEARRANYNENSCWGWITDTIAEGKKAREKFAAELLDSPHTAMHRLEWSQGLAEEIFAEQQALIAQRLMTDREISALEACTLVAKQLANDLLENHFRGGSSSDAFNAVDYARRVAASNIISHLKWYGVEL